MVERENFSRLVEGESVLVRDLIEEDPTNGTFLLKLVLNEILTMASDGENGLFVKLSPEIDYTIFQQ